MGRRTVVMKLICSRGHCECDGHTVHELSQRRLTADWLDPRESDCSRVDSKVSSDWLQSYIKATRPVLEIFKMAGYFPDSPRIATTLSTHLTNCLSKLCTCLPDWFTDQMIDSLSTQVNKLLDSLCSSSKWALWVVKAKISSKNVRAPVLEVRTAGYIEIAVFQNVMPPDLVNDYQCFGGIRSVHLNLEMCRVSWKRKHLIPSKHT